MRWPTASSFALLHACGFSFRNEAVIPPEPPTDEATRGTAFGTVVEVSINGGPQGTLVELPREEARLLEAMVGHALVWLKEHKRAGWIAERLFSWNPRTDVGTEWKEEPAGEDRRWYDSAEKRAKYGVDPEELFARLDIVSLDGEVEADAERILSVRDWKTTSDGAPAIDATDQLEGGALFVARAWGYDSARIVTLKVTEFGVEPIEGEPIDFFGLVTIAERLKADVARIPTAQPEPGDHCTTRYCKALTTCDRAGKGAPAALAQVIPAEALVAKRFAFSTQIESPDHLQWLLEVKPVVKKALELVGAAIEAYVAEGPVTATDGSVIEKRWRNMPRLNTDQLVSLAKEKGATDDDINACWHGQREGNGVRAAKPSKKGRAA